MKGMAPSKLALLGLVLLSGVVHVLTDFNEYFWNVNYIYHEHHDLLMMIYRDTNTCYFTHVDESTKKAFANCHWQYMMQDVYDRIAFGEDAVVKPSDLDTIRNTYQDVLANFRCSGHTIFTLDTTFGEDYITQCQPQEEIGKK